MMLRQYQTITNHDCCQKNTARQAHFGPCNNGCKNTLLALAFFSLIRFIREALRQSHGTLAIGLSLSNIWRTFQH